MRSKVNLFLSQAAVAVGALLIAVAITRAALATDVVHDAMPSSIWSMFAMMLSVPGGVAPVPEIDPGAAGNALALLAGGVLLVVGLRRKRAEPTVS